MPDQRIAAMWRCPPEDFDLLVAQQGTSESATGRPLISDYESYEARLRELAAEAKRSGALKAVYAITMPLREWKNELRCRNLPDTPEGWGQCAIALLVPYDRLALRIGHRTVGWAAATAADMPLESKDVMRLA